MSDNNVDSMRDTSGKYKDYSNSMLSEFKSLKKLGNGLGENAWNGNAVTRFNDWCDLAV